MFFEVLPLGAILAVMEILVVIGSATIVIVLISSGLFKAIDSWFRPKSNGFGKVINKDNTKIKEMGVTMCSLRSILVGVMGRTDNVYVIKEFYTSTKIGDVVNVSYVTGRISGGVYIKMINV